MATFSRTTNSAVWVYPVLMGVALGMTLTTLVTIAQLSTPPELMAIATGLMHIFRAVGGAAGLAVCKFYAALVAADNRIR
jgi:hypothetical protein